MMFNSTSPTACRDTARHPQANRTPYPSMVFSPRPLKQVLADDATLRRWEERRRHLDALTRIVRGLHPRPLAERIHVADADGPELTLACDAGATAAIVRQRGPDMLAALRREGWEFSAIRVRVQVRADPAPSPKATPNQLDRSAFRHLAALARGLSPGPLKAALERFLRRSG
jgi:hypothetical protein